MTGRVDLGEAGSLDTGECYGTCHSADAYSMVRVMGPCRVMLPGGGEALVCCSGRRTLQTRYDSDQGPLRALPDERGVRV